MNMLAEKKGVALREYKPEDLSAIHRILCDPITMRHWPSPFNKEKSKAWVDRAMKSYEEHGFGRWALIRIENDEIIGDAGLLLSWVNGKEELDLGCILHHPWWHRGIGTRACQLVIEFAREKQLGDSLVANMATNHHFSRKLVESLGFTLETTFKNERNRDLPTYLYRLAI